MFIFIVIFILIFTFCSTAAVRQQELGDLIGHCHVVLCDAGVQERAERDIVRLQVVPQVEVGFIFLVSPEGHHIYTLTNVKI